MKNINLYYQGFIDKIIWKVYMQIWDMRPLELQVYIYNIGKVLQAWAQAFLGEDLDITDTWDMEEFAEVIEQLRIMRTIVTLIKIKT